MADVGKSKAVVAAERVNARVPGVRVTAHHGRIEEMPPEWYQQFQIIILGLDSLEARRYMNTLVCSFLGAFAARCTGFTMTLDWLHEALHVCVRVQLPVCFCSALHSLVTCGSWQVC